MRTAIIIPCYNEELRLETGQIVDFIRKRNDVHLFFVNDGSTDKTLDLLNSIYIEYSKQVSVVNLEKNCGKAEAVRLGILEANSKRKFEYLMFLDADFSTSLEECLRFIEYADEHESVKVICGSRIKRMGSEIQRSSRRHYLGRSFATISYTVLPLPMYDTQCGAKLFRSEIIDIGFSQPFVSKWLFDIEILLRLSSSIGYQRALNEIYEIPLLKWKEIGGSKINFKSLVGLPLQLANIYFKYRSQISSIKSGIKS